MGKNNKSKRVAVVALLTLLVFIPRFAISQVSNMPPEVQKTLSEVGPVWNLSVAENIQKTLRSYTPVLKNAPKFVGLIVRDVAYGDDAENSLDIYEPVRRISTLAPVVVFIHGGGYTSGDKDVSEEVYGNVPTYFARHGVVGVNLNYRLAPTAQWPAGAQDVGAGVRWLKENIARYGGDPTKIFLIGHSAGATHVAGYIYDARFQPDGGPGVKGVVLMSGRYEVVPEPGDVGLWGIEAYFGKDPSKYPDRSAMEHITESRPIPTLVVFAEYDQQGLDIQGAALISALCRRDNVCPPAVRMQGHNHLSMVYQFNTADEMLGNEVINFIESTH